MINRHDDDKFINLISPLLFTKGIPNNLLLKFFIRAYTEKASFFDNMNNALSRIQDQIAQEKNKVVNEDNCIDYLDIPDIDALKIIASETSLEEMVAIVRRSFERKKITFDEAINFTRNSSRDLFAIKFLKEKALNKYKN